MTVSLNSGFAFDEPRVHIQPGLIDGSTVEVTIQGDYGHFTLTGDLHELRLLIVETDNALTRYANDLEDNGDA